MTGSNSSTTNNTSSSNSNSNSNSTSNGNSNGNGMTGPGASAAAFLLSADELHVLESRSPHIVLPAAFSTRWESSLDPAEIDARERTAVERLTSRGILSAGSAGTAGSAATSHTTPIPADLTDRVNPDFGRFISIPQFATVTIDATSWTLERTAVQSISALGGFAVELLRTQRVDHTRVADGKGAAAQDEDAVEIRAFTIDGVADQLLRPLTAWDDSTERPGRPRETVVLSLIDAEALVLALRDARPEVLAAVLDRLQSPGASAVFGGIAARIDGGFRFDLLSRVSGSRMTRVWLRSADGWVAVAIDHPDVTPDTTTEAFRDGTRVAVKAVRKADIVSEILTLGALLVGEAARLQGDAA
ncbi:hypothetical protein [Plantibacter sp. YIM 135347]|uniref:hypothetical protein n=1 Tax=Plantibacter sp. YIM 135347 TaxID=3423919 RepID=UPI003D33AE7F